MINPLSVSVSDVSKEEITPSESGSNQVADEEEDSSLSGSGNDDPPSLVAAKPSASGFCAGMICFCIILTFNFAIINLALQ